MAISSSLKNSLLKDNGIHIGRIGITLHLTVEEDVKETEVHYPFQVIPLRLSISISKRIYAADCDPNTEWSLACCSARLLSRPVFHQCTNRSLLRRSVHSSKHRI